MPALYRDWIVDWWFLHPEPWGHIMWTDSNLFPLENQDLFDRAPEIAPNATEQFRADVARYEILYREGGVFLDVDFEPHKPIDSLMDGEPWVVRHANKWVANGVMAFPRHHPAMRDAIDKLPSSVARAKPHFGNTRRSGPQFFTPIARQHQVRVLPAHYFIGYEWNELDQDDRQGEYSTHHWHNQRRKRNMPLAR